MGWVGFTALVLIGVGVTFPDIIDRFEVSVDSGPAPWYARTALAVLGAFNVMSALPHLIFSEAHFESRVKLQLPQPIVPDTDKSKIGSKISIVFSKTEAIEQCFAAVVQLFV